MVIFTTVTPFIGIDEMIRMRSGVSDLCSKLWEM